MHQKLMRFKVIKDNRIFEALLDERLTFNENFKCIVKLTDFDLDGFKVYDPSKKVFLDTQIPIIWFNINSFKLMYLF